MTPAGGTTPARTRRDFPQNTNKATPETMKMAAPRRISGLSEIASAYDLILCDVWGVVHNGRAAWPTAIDALTRFRNTGGIVVLITNAPRQRRSVVRQLDMLGVVKESFDGIVTSGDVTRDLIRKAPRKLFHLGPAKDGNLFEDIDCERVEEAQAEAVVCSGLFDDQTETPADYAPMLVRLCARNLEMICANPDIVVEMGDRLIWCAGALARDYAALGGTTLIAGKPHAPIYHAAIEFAASVAGRTIDRRRILAIGDGLPTDIAGAVNFGLDAIYVSAGIHAAEYGEAEDPDAGRLTEFLIRENAAPAYWLARLRW
jgi:HAD superfamily hydrolase (TIGR01459 family)